MPPKKSVGLLTQKLDIMKKVTAAAVQAKRSSAPMKRDIDEDDTASDFTDSDSSSDDLESPKYSKSSTDSKDLSFKMDVNDNPPKVHFKYDVHPKRDPSSSDDEDLKDVQGKPTTPPKPKPRDKNKRASLDPAKDQTIAVTPTVSPAPPPPPPPMQQAVSGDTVRGCLIEEIKNFQGFRKHRYEPKYKKATAEVVRHNSKSQSDMLRIAMKNEVEKRRENFSDQDSDSNDDEPQDFTLS